MDYLIYNDIDSRSLGVYVARIGDSPLIFNATPPTRAITEKIAGRHGEVVMEQTYEPRQIDVTLYFTNNNTSVLKQISRWLGELGTHPLMLSTEPYKIYYANIQQQLNPSLFNTRQGSLDITFTCYDPFGYSSFTSIELEDGVLYNTGLLYNNSIPYVDSDILKYTFLTADLPNLEVYHGGNADYGLPKIIIVGNATTLTIGRYKDAARTILLQQCTYGAFGGILIIDSVLKDTFLNGAVDNSTFNGDYFTLDGIRDMTFITSGVGSLSTESSLALDLSTSSAVNDFYNGKVLTLISRIDSSVIHKTILDYNGATHVATFSTTPSIPVGALYDYMIYDYISESNHFKITGTGLNLTNVNFDFKYVYL